MSVFKDKVYEELDWISQAVEPMLCNVTKIIADMPEEYVLKFSDIKELVRYGLSFHDGDVVGQLTNLLNIPIRALERGESEAIHNAYKLEVAPDTWIDYETETIHGEVKIVKVGAQLEDKDIIDIMRQYARNKLYLRVADVNTVALRDLGNLFITDPSDRFHRADTKSHRLTALNNFISESMNDRIPIKTVDVWKKFVDIIVDYLKTSNPVALGEIMRVLIMTKDGKPLYSL